MYLMKRNASPSSLPGGGGLLVIGVGVGGLKGDDQGDDAYDHWINNKQQLHNRQTTTTTTRPVPRSALNYHFIDA